MDDATMRSEIEELQMKANEITDEVSVLCSCAYTLRINRHPSIAGFCNVLLCVLAFVAEK